MALPKLKKLPIMAKKHFSLIKIKNAKQKYLPILLVFVTTIVGSAVKDLLDLTKTIFTFSKEKFVCFELKLLRYLQNKYPNVRREDKDTKNKIAFLKNGDVYLSGAIRTQFFNFIQCRTKHNEFKRNLKMKYTEKIS
ncbi:hypothetical protein MHBO_001125 [Bonamia ostreae]|uniref:LAGLIDADG homing endonuclease n=1 Tax=Bonamia ostreae TaxID=126728 RepID=A0ABV2AHV2_9EUKA